jgi:lipopolysaccharide/colanic/teichoic acid biosynthesis glycosyltransferase
MSSSGKAFLWQDRVGRHGHVFQIVKLRSMKEDAEQGTGAVWASEDDPRVTPLGRYLRKLHLDELPQLWNVARGEMSFIGPRPERPEFVDELIDDVPGYECRLAVLPGVTGLAQINLPPDQTSNCVRRKIELDLEYIFTAEPSLDLRIVFCTLLKMMGAPRDWASKICHVYREPYVERLETVTCRPPTMSKDRNAKNSPASPALRPARHFRGDRRQVILSTTGGSNDGWQGNASLAVPEVENVD